MHVGRLPHTYCTHVMCINMHAMHCSLRPETHAGSTHTAWQASCNVPRKQELSALDGTGCADTGLTLC